MNLQPFAVPFGGGNLWSTDKYALRVTQVAEGENAVLLFGTGTVTTGGDNTLIAAPGANKQLRLVSLQLQNESAVPTTLVLKFGTVAKWRYLAQIQGDGLLLAPPSSWPIGSNLALVLNLSAANSIGWNAVYYVEDL